MNHEWVIDPHIYFRFFSWLNANSMTFKRLNMWFFTAPASFNGAPTKASSSEDFPTLWPPTTAICGRSKSNSRPACLGGFGEAAVHALELSCFFRCWKSSFNLVEDIDKIEDHHFLHKNLHCTHTNSRHCFFRHFLGDFPQKWTTLKIRPSGCTAPRIWLMMGINFSIGTWSGSGWSLWWFQPAHVDMCIYVYVYIYMYIYMYVCMYVYAYVYIYVYIYTYTYIYMYNIMCVYIYNDIYQYVWVKTTSIEPLILPPFCNVPILSKQIPSHHAWNKESPKTQCPWRGHAAAIAGSRPNHPFQLISLFILKHF